MSLREGKWFDGFFNPHIYELMPRLEGRYETAAHLHAALDAAPWVTLEFDLSRRR